MNPNALLHILSSASAKMSTLSNSYLKQFDRATFVVPEANSTVAEHIQNYFTNILLNLTFFKSTVGLISTFGPLSHFHKTCSEFIAQLDTYVTLYQ